MVTSDFSYFNIAWITFQLSDILYFNLNRCPLSKYIAIAIVKKCHVENRFKKYYLKNTTHNLTSCQYVQPQQLLKLKIELNKMYILKIRRAPKWCFQKHGVVLNWREHLPWLKHRLEWCKEQQSDTSAALSDRSSPIGRPASQSQRLRHRLVC